MQDAYLQEETKEKGIVKIKDLMPIQDGIYIWQGDITTLECDAIINTANSGMTGCYVSNHACTDNCIHTLLESLYLYQSLYERTQKGV